VNALSEFIELLRNNPCEGEFSCLVFRLHVGLDFSW